MKGCFSCLTKKKEGFVCRICGVKFYFEKDLEEHYEDHLAEDTSKTYDTFSRIKL